MLGKLTQCELCQNINCSGQGKRNINFSKQHICGSFIKEIVCTFDDGYRFVSKNDFDAEKEYILLDENNDIVLKINLNKFDIINILIYVDKNDGDIKILEQGLLKRLYLDKFFSKKLKNYLYTFVMNKNIIFSCTSDNEKSYDNDFTNINLLTYLINNKEQYLEFEEKILKEAKYPLMYLFASYCNPFENFNITLKKLEQAVINSEDAETIYYFLKQNNKEYIDVKKLQQALIKTKDVYYIMELLIEYEYRDLTDKDKNNIEFIIFDSKNSYNIYSFTSYTNWSDKEKAWKYFADIKDYKYLIKIISNFKFNIEETKQIILESKDINFIVDFIECFQTTDMESVIDTIININNSKDTYIFVCEMLDMEIDISKFRIVLENIIKKDKNIYKEYLEYLEELED